MIVEKATVVKHETGFLTVATVRQNACGSCSAQAGCGHGLMNRMGMGRLNEVPVVWGAFSPSDVSVGDVVTIAVPEKVVVLGSLQLYIVPLLLMIIGMTVGHYTLGSDLASFVGAAVGLLLALFFNAWFGQRFISKLAHRPVLEGLSTKADESPVAFTP